MSGEGDTPQALRKLLPGKLVIASHNAGKLAEFADLLGPFGLEAKSAKEFGLPEPEETETTFVGNALLKARAAADGAAMHADGSLLEVVVAAVEAAEVALVNTTEQLESLRQAGVVDAGGAGLVIVLQSLRRVVESGGGPVRPLTEPPAWLTKEAAVLTTDCGDDDERSERYFQCIMGDLDGLKPGWTRLNLAPWATDEEADFLLSAIEFVAEHGEKFLPLYDFDWKTGAWTHAQDAAPPSLFGDVQPQQGGGEVPYADYLREAAALAQGLSVAARRPVPENVPGDLVFFAY